MTLGVPALSLIIPAFNMEYSGKLFFLPDADSVRRDIPVRASLEPGGLIHRVEAEYYMGTRSFFPRFGTMLPP